MLDAIGVFREALANNRAGQAALVEELGQQQALADALRGEVSARAERNCAICLQEPVEVVCIPCGHVCACKTCSLRLLRHEQPRCPICRADVLDSMRVFIE